MCGFFVLILYFLESSHWHCRGAISINEWEYQWTWFITWSTCCVHECWSNRRFPSFRYHNCLFLHHKCCWILKFYVYFRPKMVENRSWRWVLWWHWINYVLTHPTSARGQANCFGSLYQFLERSRTMEKSKSDLFIQGLFII